MVDPYLEWLGIPQHARPVTLYQLLGIAPTERNTQTIEAAAARQTARVQGFAAGAHAKVAARVLQEIATARAVLLDPSRRAAYDRKLQEAWSGGAGRMVQPAAVPGVVAPASSPSVVPAVLRSVASQPHVAAAPAAELGGGLAAQAEESSGGLAAGTPLDPLRPRRKRPRGTLLAVLLAGGGVCALLLAVVLWIVFSRGGAFRAAGQASTPLGGQSAIPGGLPGDGADPLEAFRPKRDNRQYFHQGTPRALRLGFNQFGLLSASGNKVFLGNRFYDVQTGAPLTNDPLSIPRAASIGFAPIAALAADCSLLALAHEPLAEVVEVYDCQAGTSVQQFRRKVDFFANKARFVAFTSNTELLIGWEEPGKFTIECWDMRQRQKLWEMPCGDVRMEDAVLNPAGSMLALHNGDIALVYDLRQRREVGQISPPNGRLPPGALAISPTNEELAVFSDQGRLVLFDKNLKPTFEMDMSARAPMRLDASVAWTADGQAIMLSGHLLIQRGTGRVLWQSGHRFGGSKVLYIGDDLMVRRSHLGMGDFEVLSSPWGRIRRSLSALESNAPALLTPRRPVTVTVEVTEAVFDSPANTAQVLLQHVANLAANAGLRTDANQPAVLYVVYKERKTTETLVFGDRSAPDHLLVKKQVPAIELSLKMSWRGPNGQEMWANKFTTVNVRGNTEDSYPDVNSARMALREKLKELVLPYFIPEDTSLPILPMYSD